MKKPLLLLITYLFGALSVLAENRVDLIHGNFGDDENDLDIYLPGVTMGLSRVYDRGEWRFSSLSETLEIIRDSNDSTIITEIERGGQTYASNEDGTEFTYEHLTIVPIIEPPFGYYHEDLSTTQWEEFDLEGKITSFGIGEHLQGRFVYDAVTGRLKEIRDHNDAIALTLTYDVAGRIIAATNGGGASVSYTYEGTTPNIKTVNDIRGNNWTYAYDSEGRMISKLKPNVQRFITYHPTFGYVTSVLDENERGKFYEYSFDAASKEYYSKVTHSRGVITERYFNSDNELIRVAVDGKVVKSTTSTDRMEVTTDAFGHETQITRTDGGNTVVTKFPDGTTQRIERDFATGLIAGEMDRNGYITEFAYDAWGNVTEQKEAVGTDAERTTRFTYNAMGRLETQTVVGDDVTAESTTTFVYDQWGRLTETVQPMGNRFRYEYDGQNRIIKEFDGLDRETVTTYDPVTGDPLTQKAPDDIEVTYTYDSLGRRLTLTNALGKTISWEYLDSEQKIVRRDAYDKPITLEYDLDGNLIKVTDEEGNSDVYEYDKHGRMTATIDGNGNRTSTEYATETSSYEGGGQDLVSQVSFPTFVQAFQYDSMNRVISESVSFDTFSGSTMVEQFDGMGNALGIKDRLGNLVEYRYNPYGKLTERMTEVSGVTKKTTCRFDDRGNVLAIVDAMGEEVTFEYDLNDRRTKKTYPDGLSIAWAYDADNRITEETDAAGQMVELLYDAAGRLVTRHFYVDQTAKDAGTPVKSISMTFDKAHRLLTQTDGLVTTTYTYDDNGRKLSESVDTGEGIVMSHSYTYFDNGLKKTYTGPDGITYSYTYNGDRKVANVAVPALGSISFNQYNWYSPTEITYPGGMTKTISHNGLLEITGVSYALDSVTLMNESYERDAMGLVKKRTGTNGSIDYNYDEEMQLTEVDSSIPGIDDELFSYDLNGNRTEYSQNGSASSWGYNPLNQLLAVGSSPTFEYDLNGNLIKAYRGGLLIEYAYDIQDRLIEVKHDSNVVARYGYDPEGRRIWKEAGGQKIYFHYADEGLVAIVNDLGQVTQSFGYQPDHPQGFDPLFMRNNGTYYFYLNDHIGTPCKLVSVSGQVVWSRQYSGFGQALAGGVSAVENPLRGSNQFFDPESGLHYNMARYYDPVLGRYLNRDPLGEAGGINLYQFALNSPNRFVDLNGLKPVDCDEIRVDFVQSQSLGKLGPFSLKIKNVVRGQGKKCTKCCTDGPRKGERVDSFEFCGSGLTEGEADFASFKPPIPFFEVKIGLSVNAKIFSERKGCVKSDGCDGQRKICAELSGRTGVSVFVGVIFHIKADEGAAKGLGITARGGGEGKGYIKDTLSICSDGSIDYSANEFCFSGEAFVAITVRLPAVWGWNPQVEYRHTFWKSKEYCPFN